MASQTGRPRTKISNQLFHSSAAVDTIGLNVFCLCCSKIQKYSPTESAKVYDKAVNRKSKVHFNPRQTLDYLKSDLANMVLSYETKQNIVKQYLDVRIHFL